MDLAELASRCYRGGVAARRWLYGAGARVDGVTVISIGGLRAGGVGKSLVARAVADEVASWGGSVVVLLRGYGGGEAGPHVVTPADTALRVGDEAVEHLAASHGAWQVIVARRRWKGAALALRLGATVVVLDDGFQHIGLSRTLDVVMVTAEDARAQVLPVGPLREPVDALKRAHVVATIDDGGLLTMGERTVSRCVVRLRGWEGGSTETELPDRWRGARALVVTGIARPERFTKLVTDAGVTVVEHRQYRDHQPLPPEAFVAGRGVDVVLVTGKDGARGIASVGHGRVPWRMALVDVVLPGAIRDLLGAEALAKRAAMP